MYTGTYVKTHVHIFLKFFEVVHHREKSEKIMDMCFHIIHGLKKKISPVPEFTENQVLQFESLWDFLGNFRAKIRHFALIGKTEVFL